MRPGQNVQWLLFDTTPKPIACPSSAQMLRMRSFSTPEYLFRQLTRQRRLTQYVLTYQMSLYIRHF
jgi:hypothetical protein